MSPRAAHRATPLLHPSSPLSPTRMDSLQIPSQQPRRPTRSQHSATSAGSLRLPPLPRFHPANFPSQNTSASNTPGTNPDSPQAPLSPNHQQRQHSDAQRQLLLYQQQILANTRGRHINTPKPTSPKLIPLGSPGPVTPLELEQQQAGSYFAMSTRPVMTDPAQAEMVQRYMREDQRARSDLSPNSQPTSVGGR